MGKKKRILFIVTKVEPPETGGELYNLEIFNHLKNKGYDVSLHTEDEIPKFLRRAPSAWLAYFVLFAGLPEPALIFTSHGLQTRLFVPLILTRFFTGHNIVSIAHLLYRYRSNFLFRFVDNCVDRLYFWTADAVIANSFYTRDQLIRTGVKSGNVRVVYPGVGLPVKGNEVGRKNDIIKILAVGYLVERKGYHILLEALAGIEGDFVLRIAGSPDIWPDYSKKLFEMQRTLGLGDKVEFLGHVEHGQLMKIFEESDVFVLASDFEGFGIVFFEAAVHRLAIVATTGGAIPELFENGETALLIPPGDVGALRESIQRLMNDSGLRQRLGENANSMPILKRTWRDAVEEVESVIARFAYPSE